MFSNLFSDWLLGHSITNVIFQAPELHVEIHKHGFGQQQQQQAAATAGSSTSASTNVILKRFCCLSLPCDYSVSGFCS